MSTRPMKPQPFPGESPTVALAMAAGEQYGLHPEEDAPKRKVKAKSRAAKPARKAGAKSKAGKPARKAAAKTKAAPRKGAARKKPRR